MSYYVKPQFVPSHETSTPHHDPPHVTSTHVKPRPTKSRHVAMSRHFHPRQTTPHKVTSCHDVTSSRTKLEPWFAGVWSAWHVVDRVPSVAACNSQCPLQCTLNSSTSPLLVAAPESTARDWNGAMHVLSCYESCAPLTRAIITR
jgi:hypothetical protein